MDIVAIIDSLKPGLDWIGQNWPVFALAISVYFAVLWSRGFWTRVLKTIEKIAFSNWQLALLGATGLILSLASGWTTWDGMRNFTNEPLLSLMITFGIQGVMLIVAWLIGESFASGMNVNKSGRDGPGGIGIEWIAGALLGAIVVFGLVALIVMGSLPVTREQLLFGAVGLAALALIAILQGDLLTPYLQSTKIVLRNAVLWVMFLACMTTSVFFSFDSLFSTIFPQDERARAAELRAQNQVAGITADIGQTIATLRIEEADRLFRSPGWKTYEAELNELASKAQGAQPAIEAYFIEQMEERRRGIALQEERKASANSQQAGLQSKANSLNEEISRLQAERPEAAAAVDQQRLVVNEIERRLDEQRARVLAEEKGVEGTGKVGRGRQWREEKATEVKIRAELQVANERLNAPKKRMANIDRRVASIKAELSQIEGQLAQLKGEAKTADDRIRAAEITAGLDEEALKVDPARILPAFERAKVTFRQKPTAENLSILRQQCTQLLGAMMSVELIKDSVRQIDCDPKQAQEAAAIVFALNAGTKVFIANCAGGDRLESISSTDGLFGFARKCLSDSGLPSDATEDLRKKINLAELNRDDKAHRFVVTWNAFTDGNRLAYLALAIAIAIDSLVFMSGLFGANAVRSPLQDIPRFQARSAHQLESVIETALQPHPYESAHAVIEAMHPISAQGGYTQEVILPNHPTAHTPAIVKVLNAGANIGAVTRDEFNPRRYLIRPELFEFLSIIAHRHYSANSEHRQLAELRRLITVSLQPHVGDHAEIVLHNMHPVNGHGDYTSEIFMDEVEPRQASVVKRTLNAASVLEYVERDTRPTESDRFYIHKDLYKTLINISAANPTTGTWLDDQPLLQAPGRSIRSGGELTAAQRGVTAAQTRQLPNHASHQAGSESPAPVQARARSADAYSEPGNEHNVLIESDRLADRMLESIGLDYTDIQSLLASPELHAAANDMRKALNAHSLDNVRLKNLLIEVEREAKNDLAEAYSDIRSETGGDPEARKLADQVDEKLMELAPVLILLPKLDLLGHLIESLEDAVAQDLDQDPEEQSLLVLLRGARQLLVSENINTPGPWHLAAEHLRQGSDEDADAEIIPLRSNRGGGTGQA
ncbi:MAG: hypothetical protein K0U74_02340 [Alphaproteobacteria bacterium]|nr:hypothetical protein [Alphaproteobacteria bacterium]